MKVRPSRPLCNLEQRKMEWATSTRVRAIAAGVAFYAAARVSYNFV